MTVPTVLGLEAVRVPGEINYYPEIRLYPEVSRKWSLGFMVNDSRCRAGPAAGSLTCAAPARAYCWIDAASGVAVCCSPAAPRPIRTRSTRSFADLQRSVYVQPGGAAEQRVRRRRGVERLFEGWTRTPGPMWWPM